MYNEDFLKGCLEAVNDSLTADDYDLFWGGYNHACAHKEEQYPEEKSYHLGYLAGKLNLS